MVSAVRVAVSIMAPADRISLFTLFNKGMDVAFLSIQHETNPSFDTSIDDFCSASTQQFECLIKFIKSKLICFRFMPLFVNNRFKSTYAEG
jgi:hypothetical protein